MRQLLLAGALLAIGCSGGTSVSGPSSLSAGPSAASILLAWQSNAVGLKDCCMRDAIAVNSNSRIDFWLVSSAFAAAGRRSDLRAFVWWQGADDGIASVGADDYAAKLRAVIAIARTGNPQLAVRIIELPDFPDRTRIREAQRAIANDPGVELIPTADLALVGDGTGYFSTTAYVSVRDRIFRSLGM
jgi:hypothetical protein